MIRRSMSTEVDMAALGPEPDPLHILTVAANKVKLMPFSFLDTLADLACRTSPMKVKGGGRHMDDMDMGKSSSSNKRPRAYSESWVGHSASTGWAAKDLLDLKRETDGSALLPQMLDHYAEIYNKNGRIGIYTREERDTIIDRFREKKRRRVWKKKIRYHCRKNLADRRVRVKGRFVRRGSSDVPGGEAEDGGAPSPGFGSGAEEEEEEESDDANDAADVDADVATTSSGDVTEAGSKRSRSGSTAASSSQKSKKSRRVLFDETVIDNSNGVARTSGQARPPPSPSAASSGEGKGSDSDGHAYTSSGQRMRRHSIAY